MVARLNDRWLRKDKTRTETYGKGNRWQVIWGVTGQERKKSFRNKDAGQLFRDQRAADELNGVLGINRDMTVGALWPRYRATKDNIGSGSQKAYDAAWEHHIKGTWETRMIRDVTAAGVREWIPALRTIHGAKLAASYEGYLMGVMKALLEHAVEDRVITTNPMAKVKRRKKKNPPRRYLTVGQADALLAAAKLEDEYLAERGLNGSVHDTILLMLRTGPRRGETAGITAKDFAPRRHRIRIDTGIDGEGEEDDTKSGEHRDIAVRGPVLKMVKARAKGLGRDDYLFPAPKGGAWTRHTWRHSWDRIRASTGIEDFDTHELRHTSASWAIQAGANVKTVQEMLGHASASMTLDVYGHLWDNQLDLVMEKVDELVESERLKLILDNPVVSEPP